MKKLLVLFSVLLCSTSMFAQHRSEQEAMQIAQEFFGLKGEETDLELVAPNKVRQQIKRRVACEEENNIAKSYYIVNDEISKRFVVISSDERMYKVLGYSDHGTFDPLNAPLGLLDLLAEYDSQCASLETASAREKEVSLDNAVVIAPLLKSDWGQNSPFNDRCPINVSLPDNQHSVSGCVATAMAQVMNYHKYPEKGQGKFSYITKYGSTLAMDYDTLRLDWNLIKDSYKNTESTEDERAEVAKLLLACGISVSMNYGQDESNQSGAYSQNLPYALINYFGYNPNTLYKKKDYYTDDEWNEMIVKELQTGHPILYAGRMGTLFGGHQFVLDGCDPDGRFHMNYGWNGSSDGYFFLTTSDRFMFPYYQDMVYQIAPEEYGKREDVFYASSFNVNLRIIPIGDKVKFSFYPYCYSSETTFREPGTSTFAGEIGVGLFDNGFNYIESLYALSVSDLRDGDGTNVNANVVLDNSLFKDGEIYRIAPYAKSVKSGHPTRIRTSHGEQDYYEVKVEEETVRLLLKGQEFSEVLTGRYKASAVNIDGEMEEWYVKLRRCSDDNDAVYEILDVDPVAGKLSSSAYNRNRMRGYVNADGTQISFSTGSLGDNIKLTNYSGNKDIVVHIDSKNGIMYIEDVWGCTLTEGSGDSASANEISRYSNTRFTYIEAVDVESPSVEVSSDNILSLTSASADAVIYYTLDGTTPTMYNATRYSEPITLTHNCTVKAMAFKSDNFSDITTYEVNWFTVTTPLITIDETKKTVTITTDTSEADIFYTTDETTPSIGSTKYEGSFTCENTCIIKAIAIKADYNNSQVSTKLFAVGEDERNMTVANNVAGELGSLIPEANRPEMLALTVTGELNGTDIKLIRDMLQNGKLYVLNLKETSIVAGGEKYDGIYSTQDDVIGNGMFEYSKVLQSLSLPFGIKTIESFVFTGCNNLHYLEIPSMVEKIDGYAFSNNLGMEHIEVAPENNHFKSVDGIVFSKDGSTLVLCPIKKSLSSYAIPEGVKEIAMRAFRGSSVITVSFPSSLEIVGSYAFNGCSQLKEVILPTSVTTVGSGAFEGCKNLGKVVLSTEIKKIDSFTFSSCVNLKEVNLGEKVESIDPHAFTRCTSLQEINVAEDNETFCSVDGVVYSKDMSTLVITPRGLFTEQFIVPDGVESVADHAFEGCISIGSIYLPATLEEIGEYAFSNALITNVNIPESVTSIGERAFESCKNLEVLVIPEGVTRLENSLAAHCVNLSYVYIPSSIEFIGSHSFYGCTNLQVINSKIKDIEKIKFYTSQWEPVSEAFAKIPSDCTWRIPIGPKNNEELYANQYRNRDKNPWWVDTWKVILEPDVTVGVEEVLNNPVEVAFRNGQIIITAKDDGTARFYAINGSVAKSIFVKKGEQYHVTLPKGMYIINGKKTIVK